MTKIDEGAFDACSNLTKVNGPLSVIEKLPKAQLISFLISNNELEIGEEAFKGCFSLRNISIPPTVTKIRDVGFTHCPRLINITVSKDNKVYDSREGCNAIIHTESNMLIRGCKNTIIPTSVTVIGNCAFKDCSNLTNISIPSSVREIGNNAFDGCYNLKSIIIPSSVKEIGSGAFKGCTNLTNIFIPPSVKRIGNSAFKGCTNLTNIFIPPSVTKIGDEAFYGCINLCNLSIPLSTTEVGDKVFDYDQDSFINDIYYDDIYYFD